MPCQASLMNDHHLWSVRPPLLILLFCTTVLLAIPAPPPPLVNQPHPDAFPDGLNRHFASLSLMYDCDFDRQTMCLFNASKLQSWSFRQSLHELAQQLHRASQAIAAQAASTSGKDGTNGTADSVDLNSFFVSPKMNYFPCAVAPRVKQPLAPLVTSPSSEQTQLTRNPKDITMHHRMEVSILWPHFTSQFPVPVATERQTDDPDRSDSALSEAPIESTTSVQYPLSMVSTQLKRVGSQETTTRATTSEPKSTMGISSSSSTGPLACVHLNVRFSSTSSKPGQVNLSFVSPLQTLSVNLTSTRSAAAFQHPSKDTTTTHLDWSLFHQPTHSQFSPLISRASPASSPLESTEQELPPYLPLDVWLELTVPVTAAHSITPNQPDPQLSPSDQYVFVSHSTTWLGHLQPTPFRIDTSDGVCVDQFQFRPIHPNPRPSGAATCLRGVNWLEPGSGVARMMLLDPAGHPWVEQPKTTPHPLFHLSPDAAQGGQWNERFGPADWLQFTGSLALAVCVTLFFSFFAIAVCVSILLAYRRSGRLGSSTGGATGGRCESGKPPRGLYRGANMRDANMIDHSVLLLPEMIGSTKRYNYAAPAPNPVANLDAQVADTDGASAVVVDPEPSSTQCGESLFRSNGTDTEPSGDHQTEVSDSGSDAANISAIQLMRNWNFHHRRAQRARDHLSRNNLAHANRSAAHVPTPPPSAPPIGFLPPDWLRPPPKRRDPSTANTSTDDVNHTRRQSLILDTNDQHQLIIRLPTDNISGSAPTTALRPSTTTAQDSPLTEIPETTSASPAVSGDVEAIQLELAESVRRLDGGYGGGADLPLAKSIPSTSDWGTPSTVGRRARGEESGHGDSDTSMSSEASPTS